MITFTTEHSTTTRLNLRDATDIANSQWRNMSGTTLRKLNKLNSMFDGVRFQWINFKLVGVLTCS